MLAGFDMAGAAMCPHQELGPVTEAVTALEMSGAGGVYEAVQGASKLSMSPKALKW